MGTTENNKNINTGASAEAKTPVDASAASKQEMDDKAKAKADAQKAKEEAALAKAKEKEEAQKAKDAAKAEALKAKEEAALAKAKEKEEALKAKEAAKAEALKAKEAAALARAKEKEEALKAKEAAKAEALKAKEEAKASEAQKPAEAPKAPAAAPEAQKPAEAPKAPAEAPAAQKPAEAQAPAEPPRTAEEIKMDQVAEKELKLFAEKCKRIFEEVRKDMIGQREVVESTIAAIIAGGNVLLEGAPGLGKTRLVRSLGKVFDLPFSRIQFTPDLMPADVTGTNVITKDEDGNSKFEFQKGPIFSNIVLADEINRATPKTQAALLEAMQEHKVTVMGVTRKMDEPFFVLATQNPIEQDGTYPLPEAQMDRFMFKIIVPNPSAEELGQIVNMTHKTMDETAQAACNGEELLRMRAVAKTIPVSSEVLHYAMVLIASTHPDSEVATETTKRFIRAGASPRAAQAIITAAQVRALIDGRYNVAYSDINALAVPVLRHRLKLGFEAVTSKMSPDDVVRSLIADLNNVSTSTVEKEGKKDKKRK